MGLLLVFWMTMSMVGSLLLLPTLIWIAKPKFVLGKRARTA
jgi:predicted RND superfamily exporter protein